ncbi:MAG: VOC family protein [Solirubrobacteraceae bacterium]
MTDFAPGTPVWVDLATPDATASLAFYGGLFGWTATDPVQEFGGYQNLLLDGRHVAGLTPMGGPIWMTHFSTTDADVSAALVTENGGRIAYEPMDVADLGRLAICEDPQGAPFGLWQPGRHTGAELVNAPGALIWNELHSEELAAATPFYEAVLGWSAVAEEAGGHPYTVFTVGGRPVAGGSANGGTPHWLVWFGAADADATAARAQELGAELAMGPFDIDGVGRTAVLIDPQGASFGVLQSETPDE